MSLNTDTNEMTNIVCTLPNSKVEFLTQSYADDENMRNVCRRDY